MAVIDVPIGHECKLYQWAGPRVDFSTDNASFVEVGIAGDVEQPDEYSMFGVNIRAMGGVESSVPTTRNLNFSAQILHSISDASFQAIESAHQNRTTLAICVMTGSKATAGVRGKYADYHVRKFGAPQRIAEGLMHECEFEVAPNTIAPEDVEVT